MKFIEIRDRSGSLKIFINIENVSAIVEENGFYQIYLVSGNIIAVDYQEIQKILSHIRK